MKKQLLFSLFAAAALQVLSFSTAKAGTVTISGTWVSPQGWLCPAPQNLLINVYGQTTGYIIGSDMIDVYINFGDGNYTTVQVPVTPDSLGPGQGFSAWVNHTYTLAGQYTLTYTATGPDLASDNLVVPNQVTIGSTCGNVDGQVYLDANNNCIYDAGDSYLQGIEVAIIQNAQVIAWDYTNANGQYWFNVPTGFAYDIKLSNIGQWGFNATCPATGILSIPNAPSSSNDFAIECLTGFDLHSTLSGPSVPGQTLTWVYCTYNSKCTPVSGTAYLVFDDPLLTFVTSTPAPDYANGDTVAWNFTNLTNSWGNAFCIALSVFTSTQAQVGDTVCVTSVVSPIVNDDYTFDNIEDFCTAVVASYDPNIKAAAPLGEGVQGKIAPNRRMKYTIHFQNTGTAPAYNIYILDTIDDVTLDLNTLQVLGASHSMQTDIVAPDVLHFRFDNIMLPDSGTNEPASHGWVTYRIDQQPNLAHGTQIMNTAGIFFDYNPAVITNTTLNTVDITLSVEELPGTGHFAEVFPNPASAELNISFGTDFSGEVMLVDLLGKVMFNEKANWSEMRINVSRFSNGMYSLVISGKDKVQREKIIITH